MSTKFTYVKILNFYMIECTVKHVVRKTTDWEKIFAIHMIMDASSLHIKYFYKSVVNT